MKKIIEKFSDQDLYSWSVCLFYLNHFSELQLQYEFVDRNNTVYPAGFAEKVQEQVNSMDGLKMTDEEIEGLKKFTSSYFPSWFYTFLKGLSLKSSEVTFTQTPEGYLRGVIVGPAWRTIFWEQPLLAIISELVHSDEEIEDDTEAAWTSEKALRLLESGCHFSDMGTRRRFSKEHHYNVVQTLCSVQNETPALPGNFIGTSNLWLATEMSKRYDWIKCIGTMSHQMISVCAAVYGPREANKIAMEKWHESYKGNMGVYLYDCLGSAAFYQNFSRENAKVWDGYRVDSGDNYEEYKTLYKTLQGFRVDPKNIGIVFSNGLSIDEAIKIQAFSERYPMKVSFGIGTTLTCGMSDRNIKASNIVIKAMKACLTPKSEWLPCVKLSSDQGKEIGDRNYVAAYKTLLK